MSTTVTAGTRLRSTVCTTEVVVIRAQDPSVVVQCGGEPMVPLADAPATVGTPRPGHDGGSLIGKRYGDSEDPVELLCTRGGAGSLSVGGTVLAERRAKALPASD